MKKLLLSAMAVVFFMSAWSQQLNYSSVKINLENQDINSLAALGLDLTEGIMKPGAFYICDFSEIEIQEIRNAGFEVDILIENVMEYYVERNAGLSTNIEDYRVPSDYEVPENFDFGSMGGFLTFDEMIEHIDYMRTLYPELITVKESIGQSLEGREMWMVKISDNPEEMEDEPEVLYTGLHHAREPESMHQLIFYMWYLLENYDSNEYIQMLVDNVQMYFIPCVNPDGYVYNEQTNPNGGGMWRKNKADNDGNGSFNEYYDGVDINRNYGYMWGYDNNGSSPYMGDETYRGPSAFSEPETQNMRDFAEMHEFKLAQNWHTYSNLLLYSWGYTPTFCPDNDIMNAYAAMMTLDNGYTYGPSNTTIYETNGDANDWFYGEQETKPKVFSYTGEIGGYGDGFWPSIDRIIPLAQENMLVNLLTAAFSLAYIELVDTSPQIVEEVDNDFTFSVTRLGLEESEFTVTLVPVSPEIISVGDPQTFSGMELMETQDGSISYSLEPSIVNGTLLEFELIVDMGSYTITENIQKVFGTVSILFEDPGDTMDFWTSNEWNTTTSSYHSPSSSITDSPYGDYDDQETNIITSINPIDLSDVIYAQLSFWAKWEIESGWDYAQVMISTDGYNFDALEGNYTHMGGSNQVNEPLYDGFQTSWVMEEIDLSDYIGEEEVYFQFQMVSDWSVTEDGYYFDDFTVLVIDEVSGIETLNPTLLSLGNPVPNPASGQVRITYHLPENIHGAHLNFYNTTGQLVYSTILDENNNKTFLEIEGWESGVYLYTIEHAALQSQTKKLIVQ